MQLPRKGRRAALCAMSIGFGTLASAGFLLKTQVIEQWYIHQLNSTIDADVNHAAKKLGELHSEKAIPALLSVLKRRAERAYHLAKGRGGEPWSTMLPGKALVQIGKAAVPAMKQALTDSDKWVRYWAAAILGDIGTDAVVAIPSLREATNDTEKEVRSAAQWAIDKIHGHE